jgi:hypothetical protein
MIRLTAAALAALFAVQLSLPAACASAQAAAPFQDVPLEQPASRGHLWSYAALAGGVAFVGLSFSLSHRADHTYAAYLASTDPDEIEALYNRTVHFDHLSQASLATGEVLFAAGLYYRFIHRPAVRRLDVSLLPSRCVVSYRF